MRFSRRQFLESSAALGLAPLSPTLARAASRTGETQLFAPTWESLVAQYRTPQWFRDAKFGI
jgi:alpha-L-fucosidase